MFITANPVTPLPCGCTSLDVKVFNERGEEEKRILSMDTETGDGTGVAMLEDGSPEMGEDGRPVARLRTGLIARCKHGRVT